MSNLLKPRLTYKPIEYQWAYDAYKLQQKMHWIPDEVPLADDVRDWKNKLTDSERNLLTQIFRFFTQADIDVAGGYIHKFMPIFAHKPEITMMMGSFANMECFDKETELLTSAGWVNVTELTPDMEVAQYDIESEEISFVVPSRIISYHYEGLMHHWSGKSTDICVTPNHQLITKHPSTHAITKRESSKSSLHGNYLYPSSGIASNGSQITPLERLIIAIQADGCLRGSCPSVRDGYRLVDFNLTKPRKVDRLVYLLAQANVPFNLRKVGKASLISFTVPDGVEISEIKNLKCFHIKDISYQKAKDILYEVSLWDSSVRDGGFYFYNTNEEAIDKLQAIAMLANISCNKGINRRKGYTCKSPSMEGDLTATKDCFVLSFSNQVWKTYPRKKEVPYNDKVYCVSVDKQNIISRRNGKVAFTGNCIHIDAYSKIIETIGLPDSEYSAFLEYKAMRDKHEYLESLTTEDTSKDGRNRQIAKELAVYSAFTEGLQLFSSFAILLNFTRHGKMNGMGQIVSWSQRDESLHVESMIKLFKTFVRENRKIWDDEMKKELYKVCRTMVQLEDKFIDLAFKQGDLEDLTADQVKKYIRYIADRRLLQLGLKTNYDTKHNPLPWVEDLMVSVGHTNFFENTATEYSKAATTGTWDEVWAEYDVKEIAN